MDGNLVLVVDDDPDARQLIKTVLQERCGITAILASSGKEALQRAQDLRPSLVLLDFRLPRVDGLEVIRRLKSNLSTRRIPVIAVSGWDPQKERGLAQTAGYDDFLEKPFDLNELEAKVRAFLKGLDGASKKKEASSVHVLGGRAPAKLPG